MGLTRSSPITWTPEIAYAVGLMATDGCLSKSGRHLWFVSADRDLCETLMRCIGHTVKILMDGNAYRIALGDVELYRFLVDAGLTPRKSLTLGPIAAPDELLVPLARGLLDGDGSIVRQRVTPNPKRYPLHTYDQLSVVFRSASQQHITWLKDALARVVRVRGAVMFEVMRSGNSLYTLKFGKHASIELLERIYEDPSSPRLERKWRVWEAYRRDPPKTRIWKRRSDGTEDIGASRASGSQDP